MTYRQYIVTLALSASISGIGWLLVLVRIDPIGAGLYGVVLFLGSLWLAIVSSLALALLVAGVRDDPEAVLTRIATRSFTRALIAGTATVGFLISVHRWYIGSTRVWALLIWLGVAIIADRIIVKLSNRPRGLPPRSSL